MQLGRKRFESQNEWVIRRLPKTKRPYARKGFPRDSRTQVELEQQEEEKPITEDEITLIDIGSTTIDEPSFG